jgi:hypothetical protein
VSIPAQRLKEERGRLRALPFKAEEYALRFPSALPQAYAEQGVREAHSVA